MRSPEERHKQAISTGNRHDSGHGLNAEFSPQLDNIRRWGLCDNDSVHRDQDLGVGLGRKQRPFLV